MKETISKVKRQPSECEKITGNETTDKELISKINKQLIQLNTRKISNPIKEQAEDLNRHFSKPDIQMAKKHMKKMLIIAHYQRNANQNYNEVSSHTGQNGQTTIKKSANNKCWRECGEKGTLLHCWWEYKLIQPQWRTVQRILKKQDRITT